MLRYWEFADGYYVQDGKPSPEWYHVRTALREPGEEALHAGMLPWFPAIQDGPTRIDEQGREVFSFTFRFK